MAKLLATVVARVCHRIEAAVKVWRRISTYGFIEDMSADLIGIGITGAVTLLGVALGGWLSVRGQDRMWHRDHARQWRDIRLSVYRDFLAAYREYIAFIQEPTAKVTAAPHPRIAGEMMPFFDKNGMPCRQKLEANRMAVTLVSERAETRAALLTLMRLFEVNRDAGTGWLLPVMPARGGA